MKKQIVVALALLLGSFTYAQKDEIKAAEKAIKSGNYADAKSAINSAEALIANADDKTKAKFYFLKGQALYANGNSSDADISTAIESFNMVKTIEEQSGKSKYSGDVDEIKQDMLTSFLKTANEALQKKDYLASSKGFEKAIKCHQRTHYIFIMQLPLLCLQVSMMLL